MQVRVLPSFSKSRYTKPRHKRGPAFTSKKGGYLVHGFDHDESGIGYVILVNNYHEIWWVNNQHVRVVKE